MTDKQRGGKRTGAGRKPINPMAKKIPYNLKLPRWLVEWLREHEDPAAILIEDALSEKHNLK